MVGHLVAGLATAYRAHIRRPFLAAFLDLAEVAALRHLVDGAGRDAEAQRAAAEVLRLEPNFSVEAWAARRGTPTELSIREAEALRKTGLPE